MTHPVPLVELVDVTTADGLTLNGALAAAPVLGGSARFDAALLMHGVGGRFHDSFYRNFSAALVANGTATLRANNRGHDVVNRGNAKGAFAGAALERIDACEHDWRAWLDLLERRGYRRILLFGHSLGAVKSAYYLATTRDPRVTGCVLASPPRFNPERMLASSRGAEFGAMLETARTLVATGRGDDLMRTTYPVKSFAGASAYLAKYSTPAFDVFAHLPSIPCPVLGLTGSEEFGDPTFADHPAEYANAQKSKRDITFVIVPDGDHHYSRAQTFVTERLLAWSAEG